MLKIPKWAKEEIKEREKIHGKTKVILIEKNLYQIIFEDNFFTFYKKLSKNA